LEQFARDSMITNQGLLRSHAGGSLLAGGSGRGSMSCSMERYDEFAIGWNEIFDQDFPGGSFGGGALPSSASGAPSPRRASASPAAGSAAAPNSARTGSRARQTASSGGDAAFWASEVLTSKKPPPYLRIAGGQRSAIDKGMKERLMDCPMTELRKPSEVMEIQLDQLRTHVAAAHRKKLREARQNRRLQRRCRVRDGEDLEELQDRYARSELLKPMFPDPVEHAQAAKGPGLHGRMTKDFFIKLGRHQVSPRMGGAAAGSAAGDPGGVGASTSGAAAVNLAAAALPEEPHTVR